MKTSIVFFLLFIIAGFSGCQKNNDAVEEIKTIHLDEKSARLVEADNTFGIEMFQTIRELSTEDNLMISPLSISVALAMAYNGANGDTKTEMEKVLHLYGLSAKEINESYEKLINALQSVDDKVVFELANAIFYKEGFSVKQDFLNINRNYYDAEVTPLDFGSPKAVETINNWVAEKTHDKILSIIEQLNPLDRMVLLNAVYFNGIWATEFDEEGTKMRNFKKSDGSNIEVAMMNKEDKLEYAENPLFSSVKLPYGNGQYNMVVMLPKAENSSKEIIKELSPGNWKKWKSEFNVEEHVVVTMPRFKFAYEIKLNDILKDMGMKKAFDAYGADFTKITEQEDLYISAVAHKSFIDVNESGTEAAAVTAITFTTTSAPADTVKKIYFTVDRPYVFAITEKDTGAILFIGEVQNPEYEE